MKRLLLSSLFVVALARTAGAWQLPTGGFVQVPPGRAEDIQIDDVNFTISPGANFSVDNFTLQLVDNPTLFIVEAPPLYNTFDTLNYTNRGFMFANPGFDFRFFPTQPPPPQPGVPFDISHMAGNFVNLANGFNGGTISATGFLPIFINIADPALLEGFAPQVRVSATNIIDSGTITMDTSGLIKFIGQNVDLTRGQFTMTNTFAAFGIDNGFGTNIFPWDPSVDLGPTFAISSIFFSVNFLPPVPQMVLLNSVPYFENNPPPGVVVSSNYIIYRAVFLQDSSPPDVVKNVYFGPSPVGIGEVHIEWAGGYNDPLTGQPFTNYLYLSDDYIFGSSTNVFVFNGIPDNFTFAEFPFQAVALAPQAPGFPSPDPIPPGNVTNIYRYVNANLVPSLLINTNPVITLTNLLGRIEIDALHNLQMDHTRITAPTYLSLRATNQFDGNTGAVVESPFTDLNLGVTNGSLTLTNLLVPVLPAWNGSVQAWSTTWLALTTNNIVTIDTNGVATTNSFTVTNDFRVLLVTSDLIPNTKALQQDVFLHDTNSLFISDTLNIFRHFFSDAISLTITTNGTGAFSSAGQLNLLSPDIFWSASLPHLQFLTNWGLITSSNLSVYADGITSPYQDLSSAIPYQDFVNHGSITNQGSFILANYFENTGVIQETPFGSIELTALSALVTNAVMSAPIGNVDIAVNNLIISNSFVQAGQFFTLSPTCMVTDGILFGNQFGHTTDSNSPPNVVTNGNTFLAGGNFSILVHPTSPGDLLGTTVTNSTQFNAGFPTFNLWSGLDVGCSPNGFANNLALGRLILDGALSSQFNFAGTTGNNALYVDFIEFRDSATNRDGVGNMTSITFQPGMKIYYAQAVMNGVSIAEKLNGKNGGGFCWVSNYAGVYSSTNVTVGTNTYIFNEALVESVNIDSDNDGTVNRDDVDADGPIPTNWVFDIVISFPSPCGIFGGASGNGGIGGNNGGGGGNGGGPAVVTLAFPAGKSSALAAGFVGARGSYNGLFYDTNGLAPSSSGYFSAVTTAKGGFTAKLQLGSHLYSFTGQFDGSGNWANNSISKKGLAPLAVELHLDLNGGGQITGSVSGNGWSSELLAEHAGFDSKHPAKLAGKYTLIIPGDAQTGDGFGAITVDSGGNVVLNGTLPDGTKISQKSTLSKDGIWPLYSSIYGGVGAVISWMDFTNTAGHDLNGSLLWIAPAGATPVCPAGLTNDVNAIGSRITGAGMPGFVHGVTTFSGGVLDSPVTNNVVVGLGGKVLGPGVTLSLTSSSGLFKGSFTDPDSDQNLTFQGAFLDGSDYGSGFFLSTGKSGRVYFGPTP